MTTVTTTEAVRTIAAAMRAGRKIYGSGENAVTARRDIDIEIRRGEFTAIMGPSGSGKSTLLHTLARLDTLNSGKVFLGDIELTALNERQLTRVRRDRIGFIFQTFNLVPTLTVSSRSRVQDVRSRLHESPFGHGAGARVRAGTLVRGPSARCLTTDLGTLICGRSGRTGRSPTNPILPTCIDYGRQVDAAPKVKLALTLRNGRTLRSSGC